MFRINRSIAGVLALLLAGTASAYQSDPFGYTSTQGGHRFEFNLVVDSSISGDATLQLTLDGDFNYYNENATVSIVGNGQSISLGRVLDENTGNDSFNFANNDDADSSSYAGSPDTGTASISMSAMLPLIANGVLQIIVDTSYSVGGGSWSPTTVGGILSYMSPNVGGNNVPVGGTLALFAAGAGLLAARRRRQALV